MKVFTSRKNSVSPLVHQHRKLISKNCSHRAVLQCSAKFLEFHSIIHSCCMLLQVGSASHAARVNVYGLPYVRPMKKRPVVAGDTLIAHCPVAGYPIDSIVWERDGRYVNNVLYNRLLYIILNKISTKDLIPDGSDFRWWLSFVYSCFWRDS